MVVLQMWTEELDIPNAAIKQPCHALQFACVGSKHSSVRTFRIRPAHVQTLGGGRRGRDLTWHITGSR